MPPPNSTSTLWQSSHFISLSSSHSFMLRHWASWRAARASSTLAILSIVWCSWVTSCACSLTVPSIRLFQSPGELTGSEFSFLRPVASLFRSHCSVAAMRDMRVVFPDRWPAAPPDASASTMSMSLSTWCSLIIPPRGLLPCWVAIMTNLLAVGWGRSRPAFSPWPGMLEVLFWGKFDARSRMPVFVCRSLSRLLCCFDVSVFHPRPVFSLTHSVARITVRVLLCWRAHSPLTVQVCGESCPRVSPMLEIDRRYRLPDSCRHCWLILPFIFATTRVAASLVTAAIVPWCWTQPVSEDCCPQLHT